MGAKERARTQEEAKGMRDEGDKLRFSADELLVPLIPLFGMLLLTSATRASESIPAPILSAQIHRCCFRL